MFLVNKRIWTLSVAVFNGQFQMQPPTLATFITPWYGWTSTDSEARKPRSISDKPRMAISLLIKSVFVTPAPNSDAAP